ncbi:MAG: trypsin-like peptidase domain-containing protein [Bacteroidales bacterium]|jgi:Do/DeqQ family serine protease|nr:trypsin-like peptidase domain-containing protein [Bacteroidales bacterium]
MKIIEAHNYLLTAVIISMSFCNVGCAQRNSSPSTNVGSTISATPTDFTYAAETTINTVVHIRTEMQQKGSLFDLFFQNPVFDFFGQAPARVYQAYGSGVIITKDGYIVTNNHVVEEAIKVTVTLNDKRSFEAVVVGTDARNDLALLKIDAKDLNNIQYGNSDNVKIGEWVLAVGNPYNLTSTVTAGIVSAKARNLNILGGESSVSSFIQTDAAVNSGNSGGALVNIAGELIGINAAIASNTGSFAGYSFAIPVNIVKKTVDDLMKYGRVQRVFFGASFAEMNGEKANEMHLNNARGVQVFKIEQGKAADNAGIKEGDVLLSVNGHDVNSFPELKEIIDQHIPGDVITCKLIRDNKEYETKVTLKNIKGTTGIIRKEDKIALQKLGVEVEPLSDQIKARYRIRNGLRVTKIHDGLLKSAGLQDDFIITSINQQFVATEDDIEKILGDKEGSVTIEGFYPKGFMYKYNIVM